MCIASACDDVMCPFLIRWNFEIRSQLKLRCAFDPNLHSTRQSASLRLQLGKFGDKGSFVYFNVLLTNYQSTFFLFPFLSRFLWSSSLYPLKLLIFHKLVSTLMTKWGCERQKTSCLLKECIVRKKYDVTQATLEN